MAGGRDRVIRRAPTNKPGILNAIRLLRRSNTFRFFPMAHGSAQASEGYALAR
jgi:hypothetical protein